MRGLFARLRGIGLPTPYVKGYLLPEWWDDSVATTPAGFTEAVWTIARHLGVPPEQLRDHSAPLDLPRPRFVQFKLGKGTEEQSVELARVLGERVARFALLGVDRAERAPENSARGIHAVILESGAPWVSFGTLLDYCWSIGVPVLHLAKLPGSTKKMDGLAVNIDGRPAIVLASNRPNPSWLLFHLAHELGHIVLGHIDDGGTLVDGDIDRDNTDPRERAANDFAIELITGKVGTRILPKARWPTAPALAASAERLGREINVDPGHIVLNYAHSMPGNFWAVANAAAKLLPSDGDAAQMIRARLSSNLGWSSLPNDAAEFVARMTGLDSDSVG